MAVMRIQGVCAYFKDHFKVRWVGKVRDMIVSIVSISPSSSQVHSLCSKFQLESLIVY